MKLCELQDKHKNEIIFIVGSSPSIKDVNIDLLKDNIVMAVNGGVVKVPFSQYVVSDDRGIMNWSYFDIVKKSNCICLFYEEKFKNYIDDSLKERTIFYKHKSWFSPPSTYNLPDGLILTKDINKPIVGSRTSMGSCVHIAYCLGARVIVLLGNDCQLSKDENKYRYFWQYWEKKQQPFRIEGVFDRTTQNRGFDQKSFREYWNYFCQVNKKIIGTNVEIINSSGGTLDCFPRMSVGEVIKKYG